MECDSDSRAESLADLGRLIKSRKSFPMSVPFFFNFFAVGDIWSAMDMSVRDKREAAVSKHLSCCATYPWTSSYLKFRTVITWSSRPRQNPGKNTCSSTTSFRPVPTSRRSLMLGHDSSTGHSLPGACPLDPLVHMFNPSSGTHFLSQFCYTCFI